MSLQAEGAQTPPGRHLARGPLAVTVLGPAADVYPIINNEYAIVSLSQPGAARARDPRAFLSWAISTGDAQLAQVNFQPLPPSVVMLSQAQIAKIKG